MDLANEVSGRVNHQYNKVEYYFHLKKTNDSLMRENERLYNMLKADFNIPDTSTRVGVDTIRIDSLVKYRSVQYKGAKWLPTL